MDSTEQQLNISGVPEEIQNKIVEDIDKSLEGRKTNVGELKVGVSVSDNEDLELLGYSTLHIKDLTIEIVRYLLINHLTVVYGGDFRRDGYTRIFSELAYLYRPLQDNDRSSFENYSAFPIYLGLTKEDKLMLANANALLIKVPPPEGLGADPDKFADNKTLASKYIVARSSTKMREEMIAATVARILVGGKLGSYGGKIPGVIEEASITLRRGKPLYLAGGFGGASRELADALQGKPFSYQHNDFHQTAEYLAFVSYFNEQLPGDPIDPEKESAYFTSYTMEKLAQNNGLTVEENVRLFETPHISEIIFLIFKGLQNKFALPKH